MFWKRFDELKSDTLKEICRKNNIRYDRLLHNRSDCRFPKAEDLLLLAEAVGSSAEYLLTGRYSYPERVKRIADALVNVSEEKLSSIESLIGLEES